MTLADIRDWLKTLELAEHYSIGRIDSGLERVLGIYDRAASGAPVTALGGEENASYGVKPVRLLLRWSRNARETEGAAAALWAAVTGALRTPLPGGGRIQLIRPLDRAPAPLGTDPGGVYEYIVDIDIYYAK